MFVFVGVRYLLLTAEQQKQFWRVFDFQRWRPLLFNNSLKVILSASINKVVIKPWKLRITSYKIHLNEEFL